MTPPVIVRLAASAMATRFEFALDGEHEVALRAAGEEAIAEIHEWERRLSVFRSDSVASLLNRDASARPVRIDDQTFGLLELCRDVWRDSGGAFDPTVGPLMSAWGFRDAARVAAPERDRLVREAMQRTGFGHVVLDGSARTVRFGLPGMRLDFGGVGKGFALDRAGEVLRAAGVSRALIHGGTSSVLAIGAPEGLPGFRVALAPVTPEALDAGMASRAIPDTTPDTTPAPRQGSALNTPPPGLAPFDLRDEALGVSAPHGRLRTDEHANTIGHVLDPRTGRPSAGALLAAVRGPSAALCDAWSTAALVLARPPDNLPAGYHASVLQRHMHHADA